MVTPRTSGGQPAAAQGTERGTAELQLAGLPPDALARIVRHLSVLDITNAQLASRGLHEALQDQRVWHSLCMACWGAHTLPHRWLVPPLPPGPATPTRATLPSPASYRKLYMLLHESAPIVGCWRLVGEGPRGSLIRFRWRPDGIEGAELELRTPLSGKADATPWARVSPARGLTTAVYVEPEGGAATVTVYGEQGVRMHKSPSAEAAASVALPHSQASPSPLGTSPKGSFEHEWLEFMAGNVANRSKQRRRSQRSAAQARAEGPTVYHLRRVPELRPTKKHPHCGCWAADYGPQGLEILSLAYDFKGRAAQLVATKVTGDELVPAGQVSWRAAAAALPTPWAAAEQELVQQHEERWLQEREWWDDEAEDSDGEEEEEEEEAGSDADSLLCGGGSCRLPAAAAGEAGARGPPRVVAIHEGSGQVAGPGFAHPEWVQGRLLVFASGGLAFVWGEGLNQVTEMRRLRVVR